jgi:hypothetical protein
VLGEGPRVSGGRRHEITVAHRPDQWRSTKVADDLVNHTLLVYDGASDIRASRRLSVSAKRRGITVRAPAKIAG